LIASCQAQLKKADSIKIAQWVEDYGEDSDYVKIRVRGIFPSAGNRQFIGEDIIDGCRKYSAEGYRSMPKIVGVDVARFGTDQSVFTPRQGRKVYPQLKHRGLDLMQTASKAS
jgi:hypothetical protein